MNYREYESHAYPHCSAQSGLTEVSVMFVHKSCHRKHDSLIVCWAPLSTNALTGLPFTSTSILESPGQSATLCPISWVDSLKHGYPPEALRRVFHSMLQVLHHCFHPNGLCDLLLGFHIIRVCIERSNLALSRHFCLIVAFSLLAEKSRES